MKDWKAFWNEHPAHTDDPFEQVSKTRGGKPITEETFQLLVDDVVSRLELSPNDNVLELCCGNGLITSRLATRCSRITAVDYSKPLIDTANERFSAENIEYAEMDVTCPDVPWLTERGPYDKVAMCGSLQHFNEWDLEPIVGAMKPLLKPGGVMFFGTVPDYERKFNFYSTPEYRASYLERCKEGREAIGTWWHRTIIEDAANAHGLTATFHEQNPGIHTAHCRFDVVMR